MPTWLSIAKEVCQILFFIVAGTVTVLTFLKAKKTLLQPVRTEVFKEQVKLFAEILKVFRGKDEVELRREAGFDAFRTANVLAMYDHYAFTFFDLKVDEEKRPYARSKCPVSVVPASSLMLAEEHVRPERQQSKPPADPRTRAAIWLAYKYEEVRMPKELLAHEKLLEEFVESPFIPRKLGALIKDYRELVHENAMRIGSFLTDAAKEMPVKYPTVDDLNKSSFSWIENKYNDAFKDLKPKAQEISEFLRAYLGTENILE